VARWSRSGLFRPSLLRAVGALADEFDQPQRKPQRRVRSVKRPGGRQGRSPDATRSSVARTIGSASVRERPAWHGLIGDVWSDLRREAVEVDVPADVLHRRRQRPARERVGLGFPVLLLDALNGWALEALGVGRSPLPVDRVWRASRVPPGSCASSSRSRRPTRSWRSSSTASSAPATQRISARWPTATSALLRAERAPLLARRLRARDSRTRALPRPGRLRGRGTRARPGAGSGRLVPGYRRLVPVTALIMGAV
jgi:hypothetical protein